MSGYSIKDIAAALGARAEGDMDLMVASPREPAEAGPNDLALAMDEKFGADLAKGAARAAVLWDGADWQALGLEAAIFAPRPRYAMSGLTQMYSVPRALAPGMHDTAIIGQGCSIGEGARIGPFVVIGDNVTIGPGAAIYSHASIAENTTIGANALIYEGARIGPGVQIGDGLIMHQNAVVGGDGFSFVTPEAGNVDAFRSGQSTLSGGDTQHYERIYSLGSVRIGDNVEIGVCATVDRGTIKDTIVGNGTKIDNLVQIGHNTSVGEACLMCGQVGVAGSVTIGDRVVLGGQAGIADHITIGSDVMVAGAAGVSSNIPPNRIMMGNPAIPMASNVESYKHYRRLPRLAKKVEELQKLVSKLAPKE